MSDKQVAFISVLHGLAQGITLKSKKSSPIILEQGRCVHPKATLQKRCLLPLNPFLTVGNAPKALQRPGNCRSTLSRSTGWAVIAAKAHDEPVTVLQNNRRVMRGKDARLGDMWLGRLEPLEPRHGLLDLVAGDAFALGCGLGHFRRERSSASASRLRLMNTSRSSFVITASRY
jgi:hypothetical protein